jgi:predicted phage baseplate assembly protein
VTVNENPLICLDDRRRRSRATSARGPNGIDSVRPHADGRTLEVTLLHRWPSVPATPPFEPDAIEMWGRHVPQVADVTEFRNDDARGGMFTIRLQSPLEAGGYTLRFRRRPPGFDSRLLTARFIYPPPASGSEDDCATPECPPRVDRPPTPVIDYLAKDYATFRALMLDRLSQTLPEWTERRPMDLGVTLVEALAYVADHLSYFQDAVATEAYLETARRRVSVRRHVRLVDYAMHDGCAARVWMFVKVYAPTRAEGIVFYTEPDRPAGRADRAMRTPSDLERAADPSRIPFQPILESFRPGADEKHRQFYKSLNEIEFYTWGDGECCLPKGATSASLVFHPDWKKDSGQTPCPGDLLLLEEVRGPETGLEADANPAHRHVVRLTRVEVTTDRYPVAADEPATGSGTVRYRKRRVLEVAWNPRDALPFSLCISKGLYGDPGHPKDPNARPVSVARGNVVLADHGLTCPSWLDPEVRQPRAPEADASACEAPRCAHGAVVDLAPTWERRPRTVQYRPLPLAPVTQTTPFPDARVAAVVIERRLARWDGEQLRPWLRDVAAAQPFWRLPPGGRVDRGGRRQFEALVRAVRDRVREIITRARNGAVPQRADWDELDRALTAVKKFAPGRRLRMRLSPPYRVIDLIGPALYDTRQDPRAAVPEVKLAAVVNEWDDPQPGAFVWRARRDLLASGPDDTHFVCEVDDEGIARLRFGDGTAGMAPPRGRVFRVSMRMGNGSVGNVSAEAIRGFVSADPSGGIELVRNPLPAVGGVDPEPAATVKLLAPTAFLNDPRRAVTADDYARLAERDDRVQRAAATLAWSGTAYEILVAVDLRAAALDVPDPADEERRICAEIAAMLNHYRRIGHHVTVRAARPVPLRVRLHIRLHPDAFRARVRAALSVAFGNRMPAGLFHPDNLTLGQPVHVSVLVAAAQAIDGVESVAVTELRRLAVPGPALPPGGTLRLRPTEVARLDAEPGDPVHGELIFDLEGGR